MIEKIPFGRTGHNSSRALFGAAALGAMRQEKADATLELLDEFGINHIDVAASYGDAELRLAPFLEKRRDDFFLATKTGYRTKAEAAAQLRASLERMQVEQIDLIQMHLNKLGEDFARFQDRMGKLATHIRQANDDMQRVQTSAQKIASQFDKIEQVELDKLQHGHE